LQSDPYCLVPLLCFLWVTIFSFNYYFRRNRDVECQRYASDSFVSFYYCLKAQLPRHQLRTGRNLQNPFTSLFIAVCYASIFLKTTSITIFVSMLVERFIASYYIDDYEKKSRLWVAILALLSSCLISACFTTPLIFVALFSIGICIIFSIVFVALYRRDHRRLNDFVMKDPLCYELSTRFQLVENLRVLKVCMVSARIG
uniref:PRA1 family protein n=1 Tax=Haemonchus placei TaxID=6290 RepID=A0A0N4X6V2_HAEPC